MPIRVNLSAHGIVRVVFLALASATFLAGGHSEAQQPVNNTPQTLYIQGDPTDDEQYLLQRLNRARMDPAGEGQRLAAWLRTSSDGQIVVSQYGVDPDQIASAFATLPAAPPLVFDADLMAAARRHSVDMAATGVESHTGSDGSTGQSRVEASGYKGAYSGEDAAYGVTSLDTIHAGYLVDWGNPDFGHRKQEMDGLTGLNVVGMGVSETSGGIYADTEEFGMPYLITKNGKLVIESPALVQNV